MSDQQKPTKKLVLLAGILAAGLLAAVFAASQLTASATAQSEDDPMTGTEQQPAVTSVDDIDCETDPSQVHCVEEADLIPAPIDDNPRSILSTPGMATAKTQPDKVSVTVGVETSSTTAQEAASANAVTVDAIVVAFGELGIAEEQIATSNYNIFPVYEDVAPDEACIDIFPPPPECQPKQEITGYRASSSLTVTLDVEGEVDAGQVIDTAIGAGANNVSGVFFFVSQEKQQEIRDSLIADAVSDARHRADIAAEALGMEISGIQSVSLGDVQFPIFARGAETVQLDAATQILPGEQEVTSTVHITYYIDGNGTGAGAEAEAGTEVESETGTGSEVESENGSDEEIESTET